MAGIRTRLREPGRGSYRRRAATRAAARGVAREPGSLPTSAPAATPEYPPSGGGATGPAPVTLATPGLLGSGAAAARGWKLTRSRPAAYGRRQDARPPREGRSPDAEAHTRGAFGVPIFFVGEQMFWGNDRIVLLQHVLAKRHVPEEV